MKHDKNPLPWNMQGAAAQRSTVEKVTAAVQTAVEKAVLLIASDDRPTIISKLKKVTVGDEIKAEVTLGKGNPYRLNLIDSQGLDVLIVVTDATPYEGEKKAVYIKEDQGNLLDGDGDDDKPIFDNTTSGLH